MRWRRRTTIELHYPNGGSHPEGYPETGFEETIDDFLEADFRGSQRAVVRLTALEVDCFEWAVSDSNVFGE